MRGGEGVGLRVVAARRRVAVRREVAWAAEGRASSCRTSREKGWEMVREREGLGAAREVERKMLGMVVVVVVLVGVSRRG